jgi:hypothetical protein
MDFSKIKDRAKGIIQKRGGTPALKQDAAELKDIATSRGSATDKAREATKALKEPGDPERGAGADRA